MAWFPSHQSLARHPKTHRLMARLRTSRHETVGLLNLFWWWCLDYAPDGELTGFTAEEIAIAVEWTGDADALLDALTAAGFIDATDAGLIVHDWDEYGGKILKRKAAHRDRMRESRATYEPGTDDARDDDEAGRDAHVQRTDDARDAHVRTQIRKEEIREEKTTSQGAQDAPDDAPDGADDGAAIKDKRGTRLSPDAQLTDEWRNAAIELGYPEDRVQWLFDEFKDYWCAATGRNATKLDWLRTWRNRVRDRMDNDRKITAFPRTTSGQKSYDIRDYAPHEWPKLAYGKATTPEELELSRQAAERLMG